jgi:hypothetical protein
MDILLWMMSARFKILGVRGSGVYAMILYILMGLKILSPLFYINVRDMQKIRRPLIEKTVDA